MNKYSMAKKIFTRQFERRGTGATSCQEIKSNEEIKTDIEQSN